jgi:hypothetical protein
MQGTGGDASQRPYRARISFVLLPRAALRLPWAILVASLREAVCPFKKRNNGAIDSVHFACSFCSTGAIDSVHFACSFCSTGVLDSAQLARSFEFCTGFKHCI